MSRQTYAAGSFPRGTNSLCFLIRGQFADIDLTSSLRSSKRGNPTFKSRLLMGTR